MTSPEVIFTICRRTTAAQYHIFKSLNYHLQPQYKCELFHIYFTSLHCTGKYELRGGSRGRVQGVRTSPPPHPLRDEAFFVFAFKICLPHRSVTSFLRGPPPPKKNPGSINSCYYSYQRFDMQTRRKGQFCFVLTRSPRLHAF